MRTRPLMERFTEKYAVDPKTGCWIWTAHRNMKRGGYGMISIGHSRAAWAHRVGYELYVGPIPEDMVLDHLCRTPACVNPSHLEPVPQRVNALRGVAPTVLSFHEGVCQRGHDMTGANAYEKPSGHRFCKACNHEARARRRAELVACYACERSFNFDNLMRHLRRNHGFTVAAREVRALLAERKEAAW